MTIPKITLWLLKGLIRVLVIIQKTITYLIKLIEEEINPIKYEKETSNSKD